jgi:hypothetical protein
MSQFASELQAINQALRRNGWSFAGFRVGEGFVAQRPDGTKLSAGTPAALLAAIQRLQQGA